MKYPELEEEMWCHNYYIAALCDEKRFNNWPIKKPVELLRAVLAKDKRKQDNVTLVMLYCDPV